MAKDPICGMNVDESTNLKLDHNGQTIYFCSQHCLNKYAAENKIDVNKKTAKQPCPHCEVKTNKWYKNKVLIVSLILGVLVGLSYLMPLLMPFRHALFEYFKTIWWAVILGLLLGGVIDRFIPRTYISKVLSSPKKKTIFNAVFIGFLMSACSHGILALAIQLYKKGASPPAVVSFLMASPWANLPLTIVFFSLFGLKTLYIVFCAIIIAIITGLIFQLLDSKNLIEKNPNTVDFDPDFSIKKDIKNRFSSYKLTANSAKEDIKGIFSGSISLANMVLWWILIGMGLASLAGAYIPQGIFQKFMGPTAIGLLITLAVATIIEVCSEGSAPLSFEIFKQTGAFGNSFVFLMAGVATDYTEIGLLWSNIGRKTAIWLPIITVPQIIIFGYIANLLF